MSSARKRGYAWLGSIVIGVIITLLAAIYYLMFFRKPAAEAYMVALNQGTTWNTGGLDTPRFTSTHTFNLKTKDGSMVGVRAGDMMKVDGKVCTFDIFEYGPSSEQKIRVSYADEREPEIMTVKSFFNRMSGQDITAARAGTPEHDAMKLEFGKVMDRALQKN